MSEENKALVRRYVEECLGKGNLSLLDELLLPSYVVHMNADHFDLPSYKQFQPSVLDAFPDGRWVIEDMVAEGDRVAWRYSFSGTHLGEFMGLAASGKQLRVGGIVISRIANGRVAEEWEIFDSATMYRQLGGK